MQILHHLPSENQLILDNHVAQSVVEHLIRPFNSRDDAKAFWDEYPSTIVVLNGNDDAEKALDCLDDITRHFVEQAEITPEFIEVLPNNYQLSLTIISDSGNGLYLIKPY